MFTVEVKAIGDWTTHSTHESFRSAADQAGMVHGRIVGEHDAYCYACQSQGYTGDYSSWLAQDDDERVEYEAGAAGIPTA